MTDLEMTKLCAEAMGIRATLTSGEVKLRLADSPLRLYDPLHNDAQAMALVKRFISSILKNAANEYAVCAYGGVKAWNKDLNRAIVECVAKMRAGDRT